MQNRLENALIITGTNDGTMAGGRAVKLISVNDDGSIITGLCNVPADVSIGITQGAKITDTGSQWGIVVSNGAMNAIIGASVSAIAAGTKLTAGSAGLQVAGESDKVVAISLLPHVQGATEIYVQPVQI